MKRNNQTVKLMALLYFHDGYWLNIVITSFTLNGNYEYTNSVSAHYRQMCHWLTVYLKYMLGFSY